MSQTLTISAPLAMSAVPALLVTGGIIVGWFLRGDLRTNIEAARLVARNDEQAARWLWKRGYRSTPHAGPDITPELPAADPDVTGEVLAVDGVDTEADAPHDDTDRPRWWATVVAVVVLAPLAFARRQLPALAAWWRSRRRPVNQPYRGRHWVSDVQHTAEWPVVNPSIPAQRSGDADE